MIGNEIKQWNVVVDTFGLENKIDNFKDITILEEENKDKSKLFEALNYGKRRDSIEKGTIHLVIKVHNIYKTKEKEIYIKSYSELKNIVKQLYKDMGVENVKELTLPRVDIAIDRPIGFTESFKEHLYLFELVTYGSKKNTRWYTTNVDTLESNSIKLSNNSFEVSFYNKEEESCGEYEYKTRLEFRIKRLNTHDIDIAIDKLIEKISKIDSNIEHVTNDMVQRLKKIWDREKKLDNTLTLTSFVRDKKNYIYNIEILKELYKYVGLKADVNNWIRKYKKKRELKILSNKEIIIIKKEIIREVKRYKKS